MPDHVVNSSKVFFHPQALCETSSVGENTRIWVLAHVLGGATIGKDCSICDHVFIESDVVIGDRVTIKCGVQLWDGVRVADDVFIGTDVRFSNDKYPESRQHPPKIEETYVGREASIGGGASILPGIRIGARAMVGEVLV
jgi:UDP-2-acetamido-3-amino-2,3-dideoxy-glucuronate N-acetyltransferase